MMSTPVSIASLTAINKQGLPLPRYLVGRSEKSPRDFRIRVALGVFEHGRISSDPCRWCVENGVSCIVATARSTRCVRCSWKGTKSDCCRAEGVKNPKAGSPVLPSVEATTSASSSSTRPSAAKSKSKAATALSEAQVTRQSGFATHGPTHLQSETSHSAPSEQAGNIAYAPTIEHPYAPTAPSSSNEVRNPTNPAATGVEMTNVRLAPFGSFEYDPSIRTQDPVAWAQWANRLHTEIRLLRHVQDLGPYTMGIIATMQEDGVWPMGALI